MSDAQLYQSDDGGEVRLEGGDLVVDDGLATSVYLSLFGGNLDDNASDATKHLQWWGNLVEGEPTRHYRSRTQNVLQALPLSTSNLVKVHDAVLSDLAWMIDTGLSSGVAARVTIPARNTVKIEARLEVDGAVIPFEFVKPWGGV